MFSLKHFKIKFVFIVGYFISIGASAHIRMVEPVPRSTSDSLKVAPCGGVARTNSPTTVAPGQVINVRWDETVDHLGYFTVEFSQSGEANFQEIFRLEDSQSGGGIHANSGQVTIPNQNCTDCTLRLIQYMLDDPANPKLYYACADFVVTDQVPLNPPPSGGNSGQSGSGASNAMGKPAKMGSGCGMVRAQEPIDTQKLFIELILFLFPISVLFFRRNSVGREIEAAQHSCGGRKKIF